MLNSEEEKLAMLEYMQHFGLCCRIGHNDEFTVQTLLQKAPEDKVPDMQPDTYVELKICFAHSSYKWPQKADKVIGFLPDSLFHRLTARLLEMEASLSTRHIVYLDSVLPVLAHTLLFLLQDASSIYIYIYK